MTNKETIILYLIHERDDIPQQIDEILYPSHIKQSLTFKELQTIDHLRRKLQKINEIINFIEEEL